ncbi:hypothetical protein CCHL11_07025 [Colletotrichum chlorophyti]|uniref:Uncharacterized protein n=1 Tax=Colletotrichum chlorophyti TaxID=708187 RepID=A0A1Q8RBV1_9PEZI|nr:hypothetical protein CCHL11_07025 [Colletotrichum chlorophyti]
MQLSFAVSAALSAILIPAVLASECKIGFNPSKTDCCWGKGQKSCMNQNHDAPWCAGQSSNFCYNVMRDGKPVSDTCDADCCDTTTGWGIGCPK